MSIPSAEFPRALRIAADADVTNWVDALSAQDCTPNEFIGGIMRLERADPDAGWEALALLDQQFRRDRISHDVFITVKSRLQQHSVSTVAGVPVAAPVASAAAAARDPIAPAARPVPPPALSAPTPLARPTQTPLHRQLRMGDLLAGRYRVVDILRRDATGTLFEALDEPKINLTGIRTRVAIQMLDETRPRAPNLLPRLGKLQQLSHPAIARLLDVEEHSGALLLVMELLNGVTLQDLLARSDGAIDRTLARKAVRSVASALAYAHSQGITHGDVGATNVVVNQAGDVFLQNFQLDVIQPAPPAADRLAFAWFVHELLTGTRTSERAMGRGSRLRAAPGISREQWRVLRDTLTGKDGAHGDVLAAFAGEDSRAVRPVPVQRNGAPPSKGTRSISWIVGGLFVAILASGAYVFFHRNETGRETPVTKTPTALVPAAVSPVAAAPPLAKSIIPAPAPPVITPRPAAPAAGRPSVDLPGGVTWVKTTDPVARIWVRRRGELHDRVTFQWWTENGSALPDRDFRSISAREGIIQSGAKGTELLVPLIPDAARGEARTFYVKIDSPSSHATLGAKTLTQVAIVPPGYPAQLRR